jgi:hypothetical protein
VGPDITGTVIYKNFYANGNVKWHYDRKLASLDRVIDGPCPAPQHGPGEQIV